MDLHHRIYTGIAGVALVLASFVVYEWIKIERASIDSIMHLTNVLSSSQSAITSLDSAVKSNDVKVGILLDAVTANVNRLPELEKDVVSSLNSQVTYARQDTVSQLNLLRDSSVQLAASVLSTVDYRAAKVQDTVILAVKPFGDLATTLDKSVVMLRPGVLATISHVSSVSAQVDLALPDFLDCYADGLGNANCLFNRYQGTAKSAEKTAAALEKGTNALASMATDFHEELFGVKTWKQKIGTGLKFVFTGGVAASKFVK